MGRGTSSSTARRSRFVQGKGRPGAGVARAQAARGSGGRAPRGAARRPGAGARAPRRTLERVRRERAPQLLTIVGDPGIGKSRLIVELFAGGERGGQSTAPSGRPHAAVRRRGDFHALAEMAKAQIGALEASADEVTERLVRAVESAVPDADEARWVASHLRPLLGLTAEDALHGDRRTEAFAAWRRWFEALAESRPLALVFEDLHWADDGLLDFVDQLVDWATDVPLLVLVTARRDLLERRPGWGGGKRNAATMSLSPLDATRAASCSARCSRERHCRPTWRRSCWRGRAATRCTPRNTSGCSWTADCCAATARVTVTSPQPRAAAAGVGARDHRGAARRTPHRGEGARARRGRRRRGVLGRRPGGDHVAPTAGRRGANASSHAQGVRTA